MRHLKGKKEINDRYNWQISKGFIISAQHKELFNLTHNFTPEDWKNIRTEKYWDTFYSIQYPKEYNYYGLFYYDIDLRLEYTLKCVKYYLNHIKKEMPG